MARVEAHADAAWKVAAWLMLLMAIDTALERDPPEFTTDLFWWWCDFSGVVPPREPRALGPIVLKAQRMGLIEDTGRVTHTARPQAHKAKVTIWRAVRKP
jgi:hypothetical protein